MASGLRGFVPLHGVLAGIFTYTSGGGLRWHSTELASALNLFFSPFFFSFPLSPESGSMSKKRVSSPHNRYLHCAVRGWQRHNRSRVARFPGVPDVPRD
ncbi:hypothetical protein LY76DRAFT_197730 [Colletotrichum caudatum]|nr:hypothetical protein LY76DRAFT_197730 [Colletotrichum caudatum]